MESNFKEAHAPKIWLVSAMIFLYVVQFLVFPRLFPNYFRTSNEALGMYWLSLILLLLLGGCFVSVKLRDWILGDLVYIILPCIYSADGAYGVGYKNYYRIASIFIEMFFTLIIVIAIQCGLFMIIRFVHKVKKH